jgi:hypothetical protein
MKKTLCCIISICIQIISTNWACGEYVLIDRTVAFVGEKVILKSDLEKYVCYVGMKTKKPVETLDKRNLLLKMIDELVLVQEANKTGVGKAGQEEANVMMMMELKGMMDEKSRRCNDTSLDEDFIADSVYREVIVEQLIKNRIEIFVKTTDMDISRYYLSKHGDGKEGYNEEMKEKTERELRAVLVEKELSDYLARVKKRIRIVVPEE